MPVLYRQRFPLCQGVRGSARIRGHTQWHSRFSWARPSIRRSHTLSSAYRTVSVKDVKDQFDISADPANAAAARVRMRTVALEAGFVGTPLDDFEVAMGEALSNAILHGSPTPASIISICITFTLRTREFSVEITDRGEGFDPSKVRHKAADDEINGRGLKMMALLVDTAMLFHDGVGMTVRLVKRVPERA